MYDRTDPIHKARAKARQLAALVASVDNPRHDRIVAVMSRHEGHTAAGIGALLGTAALKLDLLVELAGLVASGRVVAATIRRGGATKRRYTLAAPNTLPSLRCAHAAAYRAGGLPNGLTQCECGQLFDRGGRLRSPASLNLPAQRLLDNPPV